MRTEYGLSEDEIADSIAAARRNNEGMFDEEEDKMTDLHQALTLLTPTKRKVKKIFLIKHQKEEEEIQMAPQLPQQVTILTMNATRPHLLQAIQW